MTQRQWSAHALAVRYVLLSVVLASSRPLAALDRVDAFVASLDRRVPELLLRHQVPSAVVSVVHQGRATTRSWGVADLQSGRAPDDATLYNVASISKVVTGWAVLRLVEQGRVQLDAPVSRHVSRFPLLPASANDGITVRRLLSHTSGLSMPAVPWYGPDEPLPTLPEMFGQAKEPLRLLEKPGAAYRYSGGGYALLQLLIEEVSGQAYGAFVESQVFRPLGMTHSTFRTPSPDADVATPYDESLRPLPHYRFAAPAAAGLYTTAADLARLALASVGPVPGAGVLDPGTIRAMQEQVQPERKDPFGHGLGYAVLPLPGGGGQLVGHSGSNEGWTADWSLIPRSGDGLVVLLNRSGAFPVYRDLLCDWVDAASGGRWPGFCDDKPRPWTADDAAFVDALFAGKATSEPAVAVLVADATGIVYRKAFGAREVSGAPATPETPFYTASLAKSLTALAALQLVAQGRWCLDDPVGKYLPDVPDFVRGVTLEALLSHTSGVPNYHELIDWSRYDGMDNAKVLALLGTRTVLDFPTGSVYRYSNSGYVLVASAIERLTGRPLGDVLRAGVLEPLRMASTAVDDGRDPPPATRALGYERQGDRFVAADYHTVTIDGRPFRMRSSTVGSGGMYSTLDDLYALDRALYDDRLLPLPLALSLLAPRTKLTEQAEVPGTVGHGYGWFLARDRGRTIVWNTGDFAGHHTALLRVPDRKLVVIVLASSPEPSAVATARAILDRIVPGR